MAIYTVYVPEHTPDMITRADRTMFVAERFNIWGFLFGWLFLLWHRLWIAAAVWLGFAIIVVAAARVLHLPAVPIATLAVLAHLFIGLEGNDLRRWALERRGFRLAEVVAGAAREDAELLFFSRHPLRAEVASRVPVAQPRVPAETPAVIGFFPGEDAT